MGSGRTRAATVAALATVAAGVAAPGGALAAAPLPPQHGVFQVTPARQILNARPPARLAPAIVSNTTGEARIVTVTPVLLHQRVSGEMLLDGQPLPMHEASLILRADPRRFTLKAGQRRAVHLSWRLLPLDATSADVGVVYESVPADPKTTVRIATRLLSLNMLRLPKASPTSGWASALHATQPSTGLVRFLVRVRNGGRMAGWPHRVTLEVRDARGRLRFRTHVRPDVILRGAQRDFPIDLRRPKLPAGEYHATTRVTFGGTAHRVSTQTLNFKLVGPNRLPSPALRVGPLTGSGSVGDPAHATVAVASTGTAPASTTLRFGLYRVVQGNAEESPIDERAVRTGVLKPGERGSFTTPFDDVPSGDYRVEVLYTDATGAIQSATADFETTAHRTALDRLDDWIALHRLALTLGLVLLLAVALVAFLLRRQARMQAQLRRMRGASR